MDFLLLVKCALAVSPTAAPESVRHSIRPLSCFSHLGRAVPKILSVTRPRKAARLAEMGPLSSGHPLDEFHILIFFFFALTLATPGEQISIE